MKSLFFALLVVIASAYAWCRYPSSYSVRASPRSTYTTVEIGMPKPILSPSEIIKMFDDEFTSISNAMRPSNFHAMPMDVVESKSGYEIIVDLPGVDKKDINISVKGNEMTISAERVATIVAPAAQAQPAVDGEKKETSEPVAEKSTTDTILRRERRSGVTTRTFTLPEDVDVQKIHAESKDGVLRITLGKQDEKIPKERKIDIF